MRTLRCAPLASGLRQACVRAHGACVRMAGMHGTAAGCARTFTLTARTASKFVARVTRLALVQRAMIRPARCTDVLDSVFTRAFVGCEQRTGSNESHQLATPQG